MERMPAHNLPPPPPPPASSESFSSSAPTPPPSTSCTELKTTKSRGRRSKRLVVVGESSSSSSKGKPANSNGRKTSVYRGVTRHRWTGRYEAHLWDKSSRSPRRKGKQVYLGSFDDEEVAARAHDLAAIKYWGSDTTLNFPLDTYMEQLEELRTMSREEFLMSLRRRSTGFARGISKFRGVAKHHRKGRWEARIGCVDGCKYMYLGVFSSEEEAAEAYDLAAIKLKGPNAMTNFDVSRYLNHPHGRQQMAEAQPQRKDLQQQEHHLLQQPQPVLIPQAVAPPPPVTAGSRALVGKQFLAPPPEITNLGTNTTVDFDAVQGDLDKDVQPWTLCMDPTGFDPFQAPIAMSDVDSSVLDGLCEPTMFEDDVEELFEEMERQVTNTPGNGCGDSVVAHVTGGSTSRSMGRWDEVDAAAGEGASSSSSADSNSPIRSPSANGALDS